MNKEHSLIIVGGGPAGLTAGLYAARSKLDVMLIEKTIPGGLITYTELVENYPGFPDGISGFELADLMQKQAAKYGLEIFTAEANGLEDKGKQKLIKTTEGEFTAKVVIIAGGSERSKLGVPGEAEFAGKGVSYCATCDGAFFKDVPVAVAGGGNSAISEALHLTKFASKVYVIHRRNELRATKILQERAFAEPKIEFKLNQVVEAIEGKDLVQSLRVKNASTGETSILDVKGVFVSIGQKPSTDYLKGVLTLDEYGYVITNEKMQTSVPGIFAAGDIRYNSIRQTVSAAGDGATAAIYAERYISE